MFSNHSKNQEGFLGKEKTSKKKKEDEKPVSVATVVGNVDFCSHSIYQGSMDNPPALVKNGWNREVDGGIIQEGHGVSPGF